MLDCNVTVGREIFRYNGTVAIGLPSFTGEWRLWPTHENPGMSLVFLGYERETGKRDELGSTKNSYLRQCDPKYAISDRDLRCWVAILDVNKSESILKQEQFSR